MGWGNWGGVGGGVYGMGEWEDMGMQLLRWHAGRAGLALPPCQSITGPAPT